jgi:hypothetical protein
MLVTPEVRQDASAPAVTLYRTAGQRDRPRVAYDGTSARGVDCFSSHCPTVDSIASS